jgi:translation initiation factor 3 subunit D
MHFLTTDLPFAPFNKLEKISQPMDVTSYGQKLAHQSGLKGEEEEDFTMVEGKTTLKTNRNLIGARNRQAPRRRVFPRATNLVSTQNYYAPQRNTRQPTTSNTRQYRQTTVKTKFKDSVNVTTDWENINEISKTTVEKIAVSKINVEDIKKVGTIKEYDRAFDKINPNNERPLLSSDGIQISSSTLDDKVLIEIIEQELNTDRPTVYTTDVILAAIMTLKTSVFPWEIAITKEKNQIIFSRQEGEREDKTNISYIDLQTVIENTAGNLPEEEKVMLLLPIHFID